MKLQLKDAMRIFAVLILSSKMGRKILLKNKQNDGSIGLDVKGYAGKIIEAT